MGEKTFSALRWKPIVKSDTTVLEPIPIAVYVGGGGNVVAIGDDGVSGTFIAQDGVMLPIQPRKVMAATTATDMIGLYND